MLEYRELNKERIKSKVQAYYNSHKDEIRAYKAKWNFDNRERIRAKKKRKYQENKEHYRQKRLERRDSSRAYMRQWHIKNRVKRAEYSRIRAKLFPEKVREGNRRRRVRLAKAAIGNTAVIVQWEKRWKALSSARCYWCERRFLPKDCHSEHIIPISKGGSHTIENLCISCLLCNSRKAVRPLAEWNSMLPNPSFNF